MRQQVLKLAGRIGDSMAGRLLMYLSLMYLCIAASASHIFTLSLLRIHFPPARFFLLPPVFSFHPFYVSSLPVPSLLSVLRLDMVVWLCVISP